MPPRNRILQAGPQRIYFYGVILPDPAPLADIDAARLILRRLSRFCWHPVCRRGRFYCDLAAFELLAISGIDHQITIVDSGGVFHDRFADYFCVLPIARLHPNSQITSLSLGRRTLYHLQSLSSHCQVLDVSSLREKYTRRVNSGAPANI